MARRWFDNGVTRLAASIGASDTSLTVLSGDGARFPLGGGDWFSLTLEHPPAPSSPTPDQRAREIVYVTAVTGDVMTLSQRGAESTTAAVWAVGDTVGNFLTADAVEALDVPVNAATAAALGTVKISGTPTDAANPVTYVKEQSDTLLATKAATSHTHAESDVTSLVSDLAGKAATVHTHAQGDVTGLVAALAAKATPADIAASIAALVASSPATLDTLNELATALANDPAFATTMTTALAGKQPLHAILTALAALDNTAGLLEQTGAATFVRRLLGVGASTSVPTRADADARYAALAHVHAEADVTNLVTDLATLTTQQAFLMYSSGKVI